MKFAHVPVLLLVLLAGCAVWTRVEQPLQTSDDGRYSVEAPVGWVRLSLDSQRIVITRDGMDIQSIIVERPNHDRAFPLIKKTSTAQILPSELAEMLIAEIKSQPLMANVQVKSNTPRMVAGQPGFALHLQYRNSRGALYDRLIYGTAMKNDVLLLSLNALHLHYFQRDRAVFDQVAASYKPLKS